MRKKLKGWNNNIESIYKKSRAHLVDNIDRLDKLAESSTLSVADRELLYTCRHHLKIIQKEEEMKWLQRSKEKELMEGDGNTKYYHLKANGRRRKSRIISLNQEGGVIEGQDNLKKYITNFYKNLFGKPLPSSLNLSPTGVDRITEEDRVFLTKKFTLQEIKEAVFAMEPNKAAGPDGFNAEFYQAFWGVISDDLYNLIDDLYNHDLDLDMLNYGLVTLVPKGSDADKIQKYRPICLLNVVFKIITKILCNRLIAIVEKVIKISQTAFIKGRYILDGVVSLHEILNEIHRKKKKWGPIQNRF
jgi:hypothetical protein